MPTNVATVSKCKTNGPFHILMVEIMTFKAINCPKIVHYGNGCDTVSVSYKTILSKGDTL